MTTRSYEVLVILKAAGTDQELTRTAATLEEPIKKAGGKIESSQSLGRRRLAYRIARHSEGFYHLLQFNVPTKGISDIKRLFRLNDAIVRFLILAPEKKTRSTKNSQADRVQVKPRAVRTPAHEPRNESQTSSTQETSSDGQS